MPAPDRIIRLKTVLAQAGLSRSTIYRKIAPESASTALAGGNPTSTGGSPILSHGGQRASSTSMIGDEDGLLEGWRKTCGNL